MKANSIYGTIYFTSAKKKKRQGVGEELEPGRPMGVHQACEVIHHVCHGEQSQSWDRKGKWCWEFRALCHLPPHSFTSLTTSLHSTQAADWFHNTQMMSPAMVILTQYNHRVTAKRHEKSQQPNTQPYCAQKQVTLFYNCDWRISMDIHPIIVSLKLSIWHKKPLLGHHGSVCIIMSLRWEHRFWRRPTWVQIQVLPLTSSVILGKLLNLSEPSF